MRKPTSHTRNVTLSLPFRGIQQDVTFAYIYRGRFTPKAKDRMVARLASKLVMQFDACPTYPEVWKDGLKRTITVTSTRSTLARTLADETPSFILV